MKFKDYKRELELIIRQNNIECELYSVIAGIMRGCDNMKNLSLRDVTNLNNQNDNRQHQNYRMYETSNTKYKYGSPDFVIFDRNFRYSDDEETTNQKIYGCIEAKALYENLDNHLKQIDAELNKFRKLIYTNGIEWRYYKLDSNSDSDSDEELKPDSQINPDDYKKWTIVLGEYKKNGTQYNSSGVHLISADDEILWKLNAEEEYENLITNINKIWEEKI